MSKPETLDGILVLLAQPGHFAMLLLAVFGICAMFAVVVLAISQTRRSIHVRRRNGSAELELSTRQEADAVNPQGVAAE